MARREWAEREVMKRLSDGWSGDALVMGRNEAMDMLTKEHARAVRIVKRLKKHILENSTDTVVSATMADTCDVVLAALQKGRA